MTEPNPIELTKSQVDVLGRPNFACHDMARLLIAKGVYKDGPRKAEFEQAVCIHWMHSLLEKHGENWNEKMQDELFRLGTGG